MNNNPNPNKRRGNFNTQQRRGGKRQKLNPPSITTRGRGRMQRGRGRRGGRMLLLRRGNSHMRGYRGRGRGRGRGHSNMMSNPHNQIQTMNANKPNPSTLSPQKQSAEQLRAQLLANKNAKASVAHNVISGTLTSEQIENQQRKKRLMQQRQVQKPPALEALRLQALQSMMHKNKPANNANPAQIDKAVANPTAHTLNPNAPIFNMGASKSNATIATKPTDSNLHHIPPRNLKSYRAEPKHKDNISFTTTVFDINHNAVRTTISTNDPSSNTVVIDPSSTNDPNLTSIPPEIVQNIVPKTKSETVPRKQPEIKKKVGHKVVSLPKDATNWRCSVCTFHNKDNQTMKCNMCRKVNKIKKPFLNKPKPVTMKQKPKETAVATKIIPQNVPKIAPVPVNTNKTPQVMNKHPPRAVSPSKNVISLETAWKQREQAMKERQTQQNDIDIKPDVSLSINEMSSTQSAVESKNVASEAPLLHNELHNDEVDNDIEMKQIIATDTAQGEQIQQNMEQKEATLKTEVNVTEIQKVLAPKPVYPLPPLQECWQWDVEKKISDDALKRFTKETDEFVKRMDANLKIECKASSVEYRNPFDDEDNYLILDIVEDFEWTKKVCIENDISWPNNIDLNTFAKAVTQCNDW